MVSRPLTLALDFPKPTYSSNPHAFKKNYETTTEAIFIEEDDDIVSSVLPFFMYHCSQMQT